MSIADKVYNYIGKVLLVFLGAASTTWAFVDMFDVSVCMPFILLFIFLVAAIFMLMAQLKHKHIIIMCIGVCVILFIIIFRRTLETGVVGIANKIIKAYNEYFIGNAINEYIVEYDKNKFLNTSEQINTLFICVVEIEYIYILIMATYYKIFPSIHIIVSMAIIITGPLLGVIPSIACMSFLVFYYLSCAMFGKNKTVYLGRMGILAAAVALITGVMLLISNPKKYDGEARYDNYNRLVNRLSDAIGINAMTNRFESMFVSGDVSQGGISGGELGKVDSIKYSGEKMFKVYMDKDSNNVYLKGYVGNYYYGNRWEELGIGDINAYERYADYVPNGYEKIISNDFEYILQNVGIDSLKNMEILYMKGSKDYKMYPYYSDIEIPDYLYSIVPAPTLQNTVKYMYFSEDTENILEMFHMEGDSDYYEAEFFMDKSMEVPDNIEQLFNELFGDDMLRIDYLNSDSAHIERCIRNIRKYLADNTFYTLKPGKLGSGKDYVEEFLVDKKKGYCTAYASAATLMFRYCGIPARYVEGYVITTKDQNRARETDGKIVFELEDSAAHAWTEIYISGVGFIPIEVTPGYYSSDSLTENNVENNTEKSSENNTTERKSESNSEPVSSSDKNNKTTDDSGRIVTNKEKDRKNDEKIFIIFGMLICIAVIIIVFIIIGKTNNSKIRSKFLEYDTEDMRKNIKVLSVYLRKCMDRQKIGYSKDRGMEEIADDINKLIDRLSGLNNDVSDKEKNKNIELPDKNDTITVLWIIEKQKYSDKNVEFMSEEYEKVRQYVENLKNSLQYFKNRL